MHVISLIRNHMHHKDQMNNGSEKKGAQRISGAEPPFIFPIFFISLHHCSEKTAPGIPLPMF